MSNNNSLFYILNSSLYREIFFHFEAIYADQSKVFTCTLYVKLLYKWTFEK